MRKPKKKYPSYMIYDTKNREWIDTRCNNPKLKKLKNEAVPVDFDKPIHCHPAWFGSELACKECNPVCYKNHQMDNPNHLKWCEEDGCPLNPIPLTPELRKKILRRKASRNPDLEKLFSKPVLLTTPFNTVKPKELSFEHYPHIPILETNARLRRSLLGLRLQWTIKHDGQNVTIWLRKKKYAKNSSSLYTGLVSFPRGFEIIISSHNQENAASDIVACVQGAEEYQKILKLIADNPSFRVVVEECAKGASITGIRRYDRAILYVVDIFDTAVNNFLSYTQVYQNCYHYGIPVVELYATTRHRTIRDLVKFSNNVLEYCNTEKDYGKDEGVVVKAFRECHRCKDCGKEW